MHGQQQGAGCVPQMVMMDDDDCPFGDPSLGLRVFHSNDTKDDRYMTPQGRSTVSRSVQKQGRKSCIYLIHQNKGNRFKSRIVRLIPYHVWSVFPLNHFPSFGIWNRDNNMNNGNKDHMWRSEVKNWIAATLPTLRCITSLQRSNLAEIAYFAHPLKLEVLRSTLVNHTELWKLLQAELEYKDCKTDERHVLFSDWLPCQWSDSASRQ